jgi:hypothetical protein
MTAPTTDQEVPAAIWTQDVSQGGEIEGRLPRAASAVVVQGVVHTRETPPLTAFAAMVPQVSQDATKVYQLLGAAPQRRRFYVSTSVDIKLGTDKGNLQAGYGFIVKANLAYAPFYAAEDVFFVVTGVGPGDVTAWVEVDPG